eukprot:jgi/Bigna1/127261/aug1.4_g1969
MHLPRPIEDGKEEEGRGGEGGEESLESLRLRDLVRFSRALRGRQEVKEGLKERTEGRNAKVSTGDETMKQPMEEEEEEDDDDEDDVRSDAEAPKKEEEGSDG